MFLLRRCDKTNTQTHKHPNTPSWINLRTCSRIKYVTWYNSSTNWYDFDVTKQSTYMYMYILLNHTLNKSLSLNTQTWICETKKLTKVYKQAKIQKTQWYLNGQLCEWAERQPCMTCQVDEQIYNHACMSCQIHEQIYNHACLSWSCQMDGIFEQLNLHVRCNVYLTNNLFYNPKYKTYIYLTYISQNVY